MVTTERKTWCWHYQRAEQNLVTKGDRMPPLFFVFFSAYVGNEDNTQVRIIVGATVGALVVIGVVVVMIVLFLKRSVFNSVKSQGSRRISNVHFNSYFATTKNRFTSTQKH